MLLETREAPELGNGNKLPVNKQGVEPLAFGPPRNIGMKSLSGLDQRRKNLHGTAFHRRFDLFHNRGETLLFDRQIALEAKLRSGLGKEKPQEMVNLGNGGDSRFATTASDALFNCDTRR